MNSQLSVNPRRIESNLRAFARIGYSPDGGMSRLAFSRADLRARQLLLHVMHNLGLATRVDGFGNVFGRLEGTEPSLPPLLIGSHLDAVPGGGRFDGSIGVAAALEVVALFRERQLSTRYPLEVVSFASEESSRFGRGTLGSGIVAGAWEPEQILDLTDAKGFTLRRALQRAGLDPDKVTRARRAPGDFLAYLEMHIEQGRVLEDAQAQIGVVEGIAAPTRFRVQVEGQADHSGATPMGLRRDALTGAAEIILSVERLAQEAGNVVGTVGAARVDPGAINVVPGRVDMLVDVRSIDGTAKAVVVDRIRGAIDAVALARDLRTSIQILTDEQPVRLDRRVIATFARLCEERAIPWRRMMSGAGHDAMHIARLCPAGMILAPSRNGISHHRAEWTDLKDIVAGAQVFADAAFEIAMDGVGGA
jgi:beta-ureidopropionase / N-carbamoyl-L-amino-acid hydrolase